MPAALRLPAAVAGLALLVLVAGLSWEVARFGVDRAATARRLEAAVRAEVAGQARQLRELARRVAGDVTALVGSGTIAEQRPALFARLSARPTSSSRPVSATIYAPRSGAAKGYDIVAWSDGPAEDISPDRLAGPEALFVAPGTAGHRLVFVLPIGTAGRPLAVVAAESALSRGTPAGKIIETSFGRATVIAQYEGAGAGSPAPDGFVIADEAGAPFLEARFSDADLTAHRQVFRTRVLGTAGVTVLAAVLLALLPWMLARRRRSARLRSWLTWSILALAAIAAATAAAAWLAAATGVPPDAISLLTAASVVGAAAITGTLLWRPEHRRDPARRPLAFAAEHLAAGVGLAAVIAGLAAYLGERIAPASLDRWQVALSPANAAALLYPGSILLMELALCWIAVTGLMLSRLRWLTAARSRAAASVLLWIAPTFLRVLLPAGQHVPVLPALTIAVAAAIVARAGPWLRWRYRRTSQAARLMVSFGALALPAIVVYPMAASIAREAARDVIAREYAPAAAGHQVALRAALARAQQDIDRLPRLQQPIEPNSVDTQAAFEIWRQTSLAESRIAADVELYDYQNRELVSRFALNLPQYVTQVAAERLDRSSCTWEVYGEVARFGAVNRLLLRAERELCRPDGTVLGAIVVHVAQDDYSVLPFVPSANAYVEVLGGQPAGTAAVPRDLQLVVYGWSLQPLFTSGRVAWPISNELFQQIYQTGAPFWTTLEEDGRRYEVRFTQNRSGIYALGYPTPTLFQHTARVAEILALAGLMFVLVELGAAILAAVTGRRDAPIRVLLREVRRSFYRKLFLFFVLAAMGPVVVFALLFRGYLTTQLRAEVDAEASGVVTVARRVFEELEAAAQPTQGSQPPPTHDMLVAIRQVVHQDVNFFDGATLVASSQRDLFDSGLLPTRTPAALYRAVVIDRLPTAVVEHRLGGVPHLVAATHVLSHGPDAILSVPLAPRQREIEREIQDLNRGVLVGAVLVVLLAAALGAWAARRVSDPVARLSKATRQIAQGRLDITLAADTADELRRLIDDFNKMTATLRAQRAALARTNQLKAWNEMARQVAHEIKNPLTPIQLAAEHLQRVHADQGAPLGPPFDHCVRTILDQVRLLRQIASEFANFSGDLVARPESLALADLVDAILDPYRVGLPGRVRFEVSVPRDLPPVSADRTLLSRAVTNLVENAIQAMPGGGTLRVAAAAADASVVLEIADTGVGMGPEAAERAFQPYFSTKTGGSGLGLPNAKRNIELNGGSIALASEAGVGTTVTITLARADRSDAAGTASAPPR